MGATVSRRLVLILADARGEPEQDEALARYNSPRFGFQAEIVYVKRVTTTVRGDIHGRQIATQVTHRHAWDEQRLLQDSNACTVAQLERTVRHFDAHTAAVKLRQIGGANQNVDAAHVRDSEW